VSSPRIGLGLPSAIPGASERAVLEWAALAEDLDFASVGVIDRLVYDSQDPLIALAGAAAVTRRVRLFTTVMNVPWRQGAVMFAKQLASLDRLSGGRLVAGLGLGGWPEDYRESRTPMAGRGAAFDAMLVEMRRAWAGELIGASGPLPPTPPRRPRLLFGGMAPRSLARMAALGEGWVAPALGLDVLLGGVQSARRAWSDAGRAGSPWLVTGRYVALGPDAGTTADRYIHHYYGDAYFSAVRPSVATTHVQLQRQLDQLGDAGFHDIVLYPCTPDPDQGRRIASALDATGDWLARTGG
jgi:alkanesulfonate monooxygenase SsuD/methylene tetrahydromethanopterin reductase-like flavin-dependent oxidoreductase (luciferase family)